MNRGFLMAVAFSAFSAGAVQVDKVVVRQMWPWDGRVVIDYRLSGVGGSLYDMDVTVRRKGTAVDVLPSSFSGDLYDVADGDRRIVWDPAVSGLEPSQRAEDYSFELTPRTPRSHKYLVLDLAAGAADGATYPSYFLDDEPEGGWTDEYKTTKLVMRRCEPGTFTMGLSADENKGKDGERHEVTFTNFFYMAVFETTVRQYELLTGTNIIIGVTITTNVVDEAKVVTTNYQTDAAHPMYGARGVRFRNIRGSSGIDWPNNKAVDAGSLIANLRTRARLPPAIPAGWVLDLPTEAQWEYACRAGTTTAYHNGKNMAETGDTDNDLNLTDISWNRGNSDWARHDVGTKNANNWGLYDMAGSVCEYVLEPSYNGNSVPSGVEPLAGADISNARNGRLCRRLRGGSYISHRLRCRSADRWEVWNCDTATVAYDLGNDLCVGFRLCLHYVP